MTGSAKFNGFVAYVEAILVAVNVAASKAQGRQG